MFNFDVSAVKDQAVTTTNPLRTNEWHPLVLALHTLAMCCGFGTITEQNAAEVYRRIALYEQAFGAICRIFIEGEARDYYFTLADVQQYIGYRCNVSPMTPRAFDAHLKKCLMDDLTGKVRRAERLQPTTAYARIGNDLALVKASQANPSTEEAAIA